MKKYHPQSPKLPDLHICSLTTLLPYVYDIPVICLCLQLKAANRAMLGNLLEICVAYIATNVTSNAH